MEVTLSILVIGLAYVNCDKVSRLAAYPIFGYISQYGIPEADRIQKREQNYLNLNSRIIGGVPAALGQYPYQAGLISSFKNTTNKAVCGGSLISADRVLTAAHCWYDGESQAMEFEVVLGSIFLFKGGTRVSTSNVTMHPEWNPHLIRNDIAVIYLQRTLNLSDSIATIALPSAFETDQNFAGAPAIASGFGLTREDENLSADQFLSHVCLKVIKNRICSLVYPFMILPSHICTSSIGGINTCGGDSGGPLAVQSEGRNMLIGVTSFGSVFGCHVGLPSVYTRVTSHMNFINLHI